MRQRNVKKQATVEAQDAVKKNLAACSAIHAEMRRRGYVSIFEHVTKTIDSQTVYTMWANLGAGPGAFEVLTIADHFGNAAYYRLVPELKGA